MCDLCSEDSAERGRGIVTLIGQAMQLEEMASFLRKLARKEADPHGEEAKAHRELAYEIARTMTEEW